MVAKINKIKTIVYPSIGAFIVIIVVRKTTTL